MPYCCFFICLLAFWYGIYCFVTYKSFSWDVLFHKVVQETKIVYCSISFICGIETWMMTLGVFMKSMQVVPLYFVLQRTSSGLTVHNTAIGSY
jgi:hypothetical protein